MSINLSLKCAYVVGLLAMPAVAGGASFDCGNTSTRIEGLICSSPRLSELDTKMAKRYSGALTRSPDPPALRQRQREWLRSVRNRCMDEACLLSVYRRRIQRFEWTTTFGHKNRLCEEFRKDRDIGEEEALEEEISHPIAATAVPKVNVHGDTVKDGTDAVRTMDLDIDSDKVEEATHAIRNVDVDGDKVDDQLLLFRTGSASLMPPDDSWFSLTLSSTGNEYRVNAMNLNVIRYKSSYYLRTRHPAQVDSAAVDAGDQALMIADVYRLDRSGIGKVCSYECGLPYGKCSED
jgi:uncharacterized protein